MLTYSEPLDAGSVPAAGQFEVLVNSDTLDIPSLTDVSVTGSTVAITLNWPPDPGDTVTVSYTVPVSNPLQDETGMAALALTDEPVTNETTFWSATLTVGVGADGRRGFLDGPLIDFGTLEPRQFSHGSRFINVLELTADDATNGAVALDLSYPGDPLDLGDLTLELAGESLPLADATVDATGTLFTWSQAWVTANAPSLNATNYASTLAEGAEVRACLRGGTEQMCPQAPSMDVTLSALSLTNAADASAIPLTPAFAAETASYTASVATGVTRIAVRATASDVGAGLEYLDGRGMALTDRVSGGRQLPLSVGANRIQVKVTAADGATTETYTVVVTRAAPTVAALVSNTGQAAATAVDVGTSGASRFSAAQSFVTGDAARYALSSVRFHVSDFGGTDSAADVNVTVAENGAGDRPGATLHTLSGPATVTNDALNAFTAAPGAALDGNGTTYWIVVEGGASHFKAGTASTDALDAGTAAGWDIGESRYGRTSDGGAWTSDAAELRVAVSGHAVAGMASMDAALSSLGLGRDVTVSPSFDPAVTEYRAWSGDSDGEVTVAPRARDGGATVELLDADDATVPDADDVSDGDQVQFEPGVNTLKLRVTAEDRATTQTYTVTLVQEAQEPDPADPAAVWHANLTVGTGESGGTALAGFNASADRGDLSRAQFRVDGRWINVPVLEHGGGKLRFQYHARSAGATLGGDDYVLEVDGHRFDLPDAGPTGDHAFTDPGLGWSWGDVVTVKLFRAADATAPVLQRASVSGSTLALVYDDEMDGTSNPGPETFAVKVDGGSGTAPASAAIDGRVVTLTLGTAVTAGQSVTLTYGLSAQTVLLRNASGIAAGFFLDRAVTNDTGATPVVAVEAVTESAIFRRDAAVYRVSRISGPVAGALQVTVALSQERAFLAAGSLSKSVTIPANAVEAELRLEPGAFRAFPEGERIASGALTATVLDEAGHDVDPDKASAAVDIRVAVTIGPDMSAFTFDEAAGTVEIPLVARTGERAELDPGSVKVSFSSEAGTAASPADYDARSISVEFRPEDYVAAGTVLENVRRVPVTIVDDDEAEQAETFELVLEQSPGMAPWHQTFVDGAGNACGLRCRYTVTITDNDMTDGLSALAVTNAADGAAITLSPAFDPATTGYSAQVPDDVTQVTVAATAADAGSTVTYRDASDAEITDANGIEGGQQVDLVQGTNTIRVRVAMDVGHGRANVQVYTVTVTRIVPGAPEIQGVTQAGQALTALPGTIADPDGLPATTFPTGYTFQWVRVDGSLETDIPGATSVSYTLAADDVGKTVKVRAGFTDGGGTSETRPSAASGTVRAMQESCSADRPHADWCTTMTVGRNRDRRGFPLGGGTLDGPDFVHGGTSWTVEAVHEDRLEGYLLLGLDRRLPRGSKLDLGGNEVTADASSEVRDPTATFVDTWTVSPLPDWLAGQKVTLSANLPPALVGATVDGTSLVLTWAEALDEGTVPASAFAVKVDDGASAAPSGVSVTGTQVTLTLAAAVTAGQAVTVSYTVPVSGRLQDESGLPAAALTDEPVANQAADSTGNRPASGVPTIHVEGVLGAPRVGDTLVADVSAIRDGDGIAGAVFAYRWIRTRGGVDTPIPGADGREHLLAPADQGAAVRVEVSFTDDSLEAEGPLASAPTEAVLERPSDGCTSDTLRLAGGDVASEGSVEYCRNNQFRSVCDDEWDRADADVACHMAGYPDGALDRTTRSHFVNLVNTAFWLDEVHCTGDESSLAECGHAGWGVNDCTYHERAGVMCDPGAPMAASAAVDGTMLVITFDEALAPAPNLSNDAFTVWKTPEGGSEAETALSVPPSVDGATVTLTLATGVVESDTGVRVRYEKPGTDTGNRLRDGEGNDVETFTRVATNATGAMPVAVSATVDGATLVVTFSKDLAAAPNLANASFTVKKTPEGGSEGTAGLAGSPAIDGATVTLTLATAAVSGDTVTVGYAKPGTGTDNALEDDAGREVESFDGLAVTNNSNAPATGAPAISGVPQAGMTLAATPGTMADADGLTGRFPDHFGFQWVRVEGGAETEVGVDSHEYTLEDEDVGSTLKVRVTFKDDTGGTEGPLESAETVAVLAAAEDCATARPHADWCTTMTVGIEAGLPDTYGYRGAAGIGSLVDDSFDYDGLTRVVEVTYFEATSASVLVGIALDREVPEDTVFNLGRAEFTAETGGLDFGKAIPLDLAWLEGQEVTVSLNRPPGRETATVDGNTLTLTYAEDLDDASVPAEDAYEVSVDGGAPATPTDVSISGPVVTLTLADAVMPRQTVTVNYTPGADPVQDESGLDAAGFTNKAVENETLDTTAPAFSSAQVDGTSLVIAFDEELAAAPNLANGAFTVKRTPEGGTEETVGLAGTPSVSGATVTLTLAAAVLPTDTDVKVSYGKPSTDDSNRLEDAAGNEVADFDDEEVTIGSGPATGAPSVSGPPQVGKTLTAEQGTIADLDELPATTFPDGYEFQWILVDGDTGTGIPGATSRTYVPVASDVAKALRVRVTFTDGESNPEALTSDATYAVMPAADLSTCPGPGDPTRVWCATLTVGNWDYVDGIHQSAGFNAGLDSGSVSPLKFTLEAVEYTVTQLLVDGSRDVSFSTTPHLPADGAGLTLHLQNVEGERDLPLGDASTESVPDWWFDGGAYTIATDPVSDVSLLRNLSRDDPLPAVTDIGTEVAVRLSRVLAPDATGVPGVAGVPQVGRTLAAGQGTIDDDDDLPATAFPTGYAFQWVRVAGDSTETDIPGADSWIYAPVADDVGSKLKVKVSFADGNGTAETLESAETAAVRAAAENCTADRPHADWCTTMTAGFDSGANDLYGYDVVSYGSLADDSFDHGGLTREVTAVYIRIGSGDAVVVVLDSNVPSGTVFDLGGTEFATTTEASQFTWPLPPGFAWLNGQEVTVSANLPPTLVDAEVDGNMLTLTYAEDLDEGSVPAEDAYAVTVDGGAPAAPSGVSVSGDTVTLTLADEVTPGQAVTLAYAVPVDPVQDESGLDAPAFSGQAVKAPGATGAPSVSGPPQVGKALTAGQGDIADDDGLPTTAFPAGYAFQWILVDGTETDIPGATARTYVPVASDVAKALRVRVTFTDGEGNTEALTSAATYAVMPAADLSTCPGGVTDIWCATLTVGHDGTAVGFDSSSGQGSVSPVKFTLETVEYTVTQLQVGLFGDVLFSTAPDLPADGAGLTLHLQNVSGERALPLSDAVTNSLVDVVLAGGAYTDAADPVSDVSLLRTLSADDPLPADTDIGTEVAVRLSLDPAASGQPDISGVPQAGRTLTAGIGTIADANGLNNQTFPDDYTFQWIRVNSDLTETNIGSDQHTYAVQAADVGSTIKVAVEFDDDDGNPEGPLASAETAAVVRMQESCAADRPHADWCTTMTAGVFSSVYGYRAVGATRYGELVQPAIVHGGTTYTVTQLELLDTAVFGADAVRMTLNDHVPLGTAFDFGGAAFPADSSSRSSTVGVHEWDVADDFGWRLDGQKVTVSANLPPVLVSATADGTSLVLAYAEDLDEGSEPGTGAYAVTVEGSAVTVSNVAVSGDTVTLTLGTAVTPGQAVTLSYTAPGTDPVQDESGLDAPSFSNRAVTVPGATGAPSVSGPPQVGKTLTAGKGDIDDEDGLPAGTFPAGYAFQWILVDGTETDIPGATARTYVPVASDVAKALRVRVTFTDGQGNTETLTSAATYAVMPAADPCPASPTPTEPWCATLTTGHGSGAVGFDSSSGQGSVSPLKFTLERVEYTVTQLEVAGGDRDVAFSTTPDLPADGAGLTLHLQNVSGERALPLGDARTDSTPDWWFEGGAFTDGADPVSDVSLLRTFSRNDPLPASTDIGTEVAVRLSRILTPDATGQPAITGTAQAGWTLTAELGDIADNDGLPATAFPDGYGFRWVRVAGDGTEADIPGATEHTYRLQAEDAGGKVRVKVTFTDRDGTAEGPLASDPHPSGAATVLAAPVLRFGAARHRATEGGADATVTVRLDPGMPVPVTVELSATGQAGATAADWAGVPARLSFAAGEREKSFTVTAVDDGDEDPGERMVLSFASLPEGVAAGEPATATVLLADDDAMIADGALRLVDGATADDGILEIYHAGEWGTVCDDRMDGASNVAPELACTLMGYRTGAMTGRRGTTVPAPEGQRIWLDDLRCVRGSDHWTGEPPGKLSDCWHAGWGLSNCGHEEDVRLQCASPQADGLSAADAEANETDRHLVFLVALLPAPTRRVTVDWETSDGTAVAGEDYVAARGTLAIGPGRTAGTVPVRLIDDDVEDDGETFTLTLSNASGAAIADATATGTIRNMEAGSAVPLTASFSGLPEAHDGSAAFGFTLSFSEEVEGVDAAALRGPALGVAGGRVTQAGPVTQGSARSWTVEVAPDGDGAVEITLPATRDCAAAGAVCTGEGRKLSQAVAATVPGPAEGALTASFSDLPAAHDGSSAFTFTLTFSEDVEGLSYRTLKFGAHRGDGRDGDARAAPPARDEPALDDPRGAGRRRAGDGGAAGDDGLRGDGAVCAPDGRMLSEAVTATVPGPATDGPQALTASFSELPEAHDGAAAFTFELTFSEDVEGLSFRTLRDGAFDVTGGTVTRAKRHPPGTNLHWTIHVEPDGNGPVEVALPATADCADAGAVCTPDGRMLSNGTRATVPGPPGLSVADAEANEADTDAALGFAVTLDRAASGTVTVAYETSDGTAVAPGDYAATSGTLMFPPGVTALAVSVPVVRDSVDEGSETMTLTLSAPTGGAYLKDGQATGTIANAGPMPQAWLARFGRTVAEQALDAVRDRMSAGRGPGFRGRFAGQPLPDGADGRDAAGPETAGAAEDPLAIPELTGEERRVFMALLALETGEDAPEDATESRAVTDGDILLGTSFDLVREAGGLALGFWGRAARSGFAGREGELALDGDVTSVMLGTDWKRRDALFGLMLFRSRGEGSYAGASSGTVDARLAGLVPWAGRDAGEGLSVWGAAGTGRGRMTLAPEEGAAMSAGLGWSMAAAGAAGAPVTVDALGGARAGWTVDALWTRTASDAARTDAGRLAASAGETLRLRLGLEAAWSRRLASGATLQPRLEIGLRHDGGDAETGFGLEVGGGVRLEDPGRGFSVSADGRMLALHEDGDLRDRGVAVSLEWDPRPETRLGPSVIATRGWGGAPSGGVAALLEPEALPGDDGGTGGEAGSLGLEMAWGTDLGGWRHGAVGTAYGRASGSPDIGDLRLGWRVAPDEGHGIGLDHDLWLEPGLGEGAGIGAGLNWTKARTGMRSAAGIDLAAREGGGLEAGLRLEWEW